MRTTEKTMKLIGKIDTISNTINNHEIMMIIQIMAVRVAIHTAASPHSHSRPPVSQTPLPAASLATQPVAY